MQRTFLLVLITSFVFTGGSSLTAATAEQAARRKGTVTTKNAQPTQQFQLKSVPKYPNVGLKEYVLISDDLERDWANAEAVMQAKVELVRAMQTKSREHFEPCLALDFKFRSEDQFFGRREYIDNRIGDPLYCNAGLGDFALQQCSPEDNASCFPAATPGTDDRGVPNPSQSPSAIISVEASSWGQIKALYR